MKTKTPFLPIVSVLIAIVGLAGWEATHSQYVIAAPLFSPGCRTTTGTDSIAVDVKDALVYLVETSAITDPMTDTALAAYGVLRVPSSQIAIVSDTTTCRRAADAYSVAIGIPDENRLVHAIKAGTRYVVIDPSYTPSVYKTGITFDSSFTQVISKFAY
jgi:hypothetical protein